MLPTHLQPGDLFRRLFAHETHTEASLRRYGDRVRASLGWLEGIERVAEADRAALGDVFRERFPAVVAAMTDEATLRPVAALLAERCPPGDLESVVRVEFALQSRRKTRELKDQLDYGRAHTLIKTAFAVDTRAAARAHRQYWKHALLIGSRNPDDGRFLAEAVEVDITPERFHGPIKELARILARCFEGPLSDATIFLWYLARELGRIRPTADLPRKKGSRYAQALRVQKFGVACTLDQRLVRIRNATQHEDGVVVTNAEVRLFGPDHEDWGTIGLGEFVDLALEHIMVGAGVRKALMLAPIKAYDEKGLLDEEYRRVARNLGL